jgi:hypothetical protein
LRELGRGATAASSTWADAAMNLSVAFMKAPWGGPPERKNAAGATFPYAGTTRIRFGGYVSAACKAAPLTFSAKLLEEGAKRKISREILSFAGGR